MTLLKSIKGKIKLFIKRTKYYGKKHYCPICKSSLNKFLPFDQLALEKLKSSGYKYAGMNEHFSPQNYKCPICLTPDRDRFYAHYLTHHYLIKNKPVKILDIAPTRLNYFLRNKPEFDVITADLEKQGVDYNINIEQMDCFEDEKFDLVICSHVLEHVNYPNKALKEIYRILKKGGEAILMVPLNNIITQTIENPAHKTPQERLQNYGQEDHVRLFAKQDFFNRIENAGFQLKKLDINYFEKSTFSKLGLKETSVLYIGTK